MSMPAGFVADFLEAGGQSGTLESRAQLDVGTGRDHNNEAGIRTLSVGLIDCYRLSQESLITAFETANSRFKVTAFESFQELIDAGRCDLDLVVYYPHATDVPETTIGRNIVMIREAFADLPLVVLSDAENLHRSQAMRITLKSGAHGFIPTRTTGISITIAAIRFVKAGGKFAPLDMLLTSRSDRAASQSEPAPRSHLTARQMLVLSHLQQGKANKTIAHELGMSESTVKVHVRTIMRKMGATNRTQAAYNAQRIWDTAGLGKETGG
jgi:DNA-binding NarL/FixJ family response regulator